MIRGLEGLKSLVSYFYAVALLIPFLCTAAPQPGNLRYLNVPHEVLAFYYPWYGRPNDSGVGQHWGKVHEDRHESSDTTDFPVRGAYDSRDPDTIDSHIDLARSSGITGFIASWWGQKSFENKACAVLLDRARLKDFTVSIYWEKEDGQGQAQIDGAVSDLEYLITRYGTNSAFLKVDGKPVIFVYSRVLQQVPAASWPVIIARTRAGVGDFALIADSSKTNDARLFDGLHRYDVSSGVAKYGPDPDGLRDFFSRNFNSAVARARQYGHIACVTVTPGYNDTKIRKPGRDAERQDGRVYRTLWEDAIDSRPDWITITSWNEWHEGTEIEPSVQYGDTYLKLTAEYAQKFAGRKP
jgi:glycoprotein endo-alpha-1,2-mannosidase